jgi:hypothetical protein
MKRALAAGLGLAVAMAGMLGPPSQAAAAVDICRATNSDLDLNGDGYDDAVVGDPYATVNGRAEAGAVFVLYGDADRRIGQGRRLLVTQASFPGSNVEAGDHFGWSVAVADATGDGCADLLVGSPGEDLAGLADVGIAQLVSYAPDGRGGPGTPVASLYEQAKLGETAEAGDQFGFAVAMGFGGDGVLAIGAPGEDLGTATDAGAVTNIYLEDDFIGEAGTTVQGRRVPGTPEAGDRFGASVAVAPLWVTNGTDVGIEPVILAGAPGDTVQRGGVAVDGAGSVTAWDQVVGYEQLVTQESAGVPDGAESGDQFGFSLSFSELNATQDDRSRLVAVGSPGEDLGAQRDAGTVTLLADASGVGLQGGPLLSQDTAGYAGTPETGDRFGHAVAFRPDRGFNLRLAVAAPYEDLGSVLDAGLVQEVSVDTRDLSTLPTQVWTESSAGTPGTVAARNRFGLSVTALRGLAESVFAVSSPYQRSGSVFVAATDDTTRAWVPGAGGIPSSVGRFGWSVSGAAQ